MERVGPRESQAIGKTEGLEMSVHCAFQDFVMEEGNSEKLKQFLITGRVKIEEWDEHAFSQLEKELVKGEASLHLDGQGTAVRLRGKDRGVQH